MYPSIVLLGYLVFSGVRKQTGSMGLRFIIQSERDTVYLENRIEEFLEKLLVSLYFTYYYDT